MQKTINKIVEDFFQTHNISVVLKTQKKITKHLNKDFIKNHIEEIYIKNNKLIIKTNNTEARTELVLIKSKLKTSHEIIIR
tara:strand:- start:614 stop:856 length:243 start_codon:yes stop_codon:yes gene_type:complete